MISLEIFDISDIMSLLIMTFFILDIFDILYIAYTNRNMGLFDDITDSLYLSQFHSSLDIPGIPLYPLLPYYLGYSFPSLDITWYPLCQCIPLRSLPYLISLISLISPWYRWYPWSFLISLITLISISNISWYPWQVWDPWNPSLLVTHLLTHSVTDRVDSWDAHASKKLLLSTYRVSHKIWAYIQ